MMKAIHPEELRTVATFSITTEALLSRKAKASIKKIG